MHKTDRKALTRIATGGLIGLLVNGAEGGVRGAAIGLTYSVAEESPEKLFQLLESAARRRTAAVTKRAALPPRDKDFGSLRGMGSALKALNDASPKEQTLISAPRDEKKKAKKNKPGGGRTEDELTSAIKKRLELDPDATVDELANATLSVSYKKYSVTPKQKKDHRKKVYDRLRRIRSPKLLSPLSE
jgi:hypothetical protein